MAKDEKPKRLKKSQPKRTPPEICPGCGAERKDNGVFWATEHSNDCPLIQ